MANPFRRHPRRIPALLLALCASASLALAASDEPDEPQAQDPPEEQGDAPAPEAQDEPDVPDEVAERLAKLPPLIDREAFFGESEISAPRISPDGRWVSFLSPYRGAATVWVKAVDAPLDDARPVGASGWPVVAHFWSEDSRYVLYLQEQGSGGDHHLYAAAPDGDGDERDLTPVHGVRAEVYALPEATPGRVIVGINDRDAAWHDAYEVDIDTGERLLLARNDANVAAWVADLDGEVRLAVRRRDDGGSETLVVEDGEPGRVLLQCGFAETCEPLRFHKDGKRVYFASNAGPDPSQGGLFSRLARALGGPGDEGPGLAKLVLIDVATGETEEVEADPDAEADLAAAWFSDATEELAATVYLGERTRIHPRAPALRDDLAWLRGELSNLEIRFLSTSEDESKAIVKAASDVDPGSVYVYEREPKALTKLYDERPLLPREHLAPMQAIRYAAYDEQEIAAYLVVPKGASAKGLPVVVLPPDGPRARHVWGFHPVAQFLANRGYAVLLPNVRGAAGYGKRFLAAGSANWGTGRMEDDIMDGTIHLLEKGIVSGSQLAIMGASYGGYAALGGLALSNGFYNLGVVSAGPWHVASPPGLVPRNLPRAGPVFARAADDAAADRARMIRQSPFFFADSVGSPLLLVQGGDGPVMSPAESHEIIVALRDVGRDVEYLVPHGGGLADRDSRLATFAAVEEMLAEHLQGRFQAEAAPDVEHRLMHLRADVAEMEPLAVADAAKLLALDGARLAEASLDYEMTWESEEQTIDIASSVEWVRSEHDGEAVWQVTTVNDSEEIGTMVDKLLLDAATLRPVHRDVEQVNRDAEQGTLRLQVDYADDAIVGTATFGDGSQVPIDMPLDAPDVGHLETALSALPLAPGFHIKLSALDATSMTHKRWSIWVDELGTVTTPAGDVPTLRVNIRDVDSYGEPGTYWFTRTAPHRIVKRDTIGFGARLVAVLTTRLDDD